MIFFKKVFTHYVFYTPELNHKLFANIKIPIFISKRVLHQVLHDTLIAMTDGKLTSNTGRLGDDTGYRRENVLLSIHKNHIWIFLDGKKFLSIRYWFGRQDVSFHFSNSHRPILTPKSVLPKSIKKRLEQLYLLYMLTYS